MDKAAGIVKARERDVVEREQALDGISVDEKVLELAADIDRLAQLCGLYANHPRDLPLRKKEVDDWLGEAFARSVEFGWGGTEEEVRKLLPVEKALRVIDALLKERGGLLAEARAAAGAAEERHTAVDGLQQQLDGAAEVVSDPQLAQALSGALPYKASAAKQKGLQSALTMAENAASRAMATLGRAGLNEATLRSMSLPSVARVTALQATRQEVLQAASVARSLACQSAETAASLQLQIEQFGRSHKVVTVADVSLARRDRDEKWGAIKTGALPLPDGAPQLDLALRLADELGDARTVSETDAAAMQALRDQLENAEEAQRRQEQTLASKLRELEEFDAKWAQEAAKLGLVGLELDDIPDWLAKRDAALQASDAVLEKKHELDQERQSAEEAGQELADALRKAGLHFDSTFGLGALCSVAEEHAKSLERTRTIRESLEQQLRGAQTALTMAETVKASKNATVEDWNSSWKAAMASANLIGVTDDVGEVEAAVEAGRFIRQRLDKVDAHRSERIQAMERDLEELGDVAGQLGQALAPEMPKSAAGGLSRTLKIRLDEAKRQAHRRVQAQEFLDGAKRQLAEASSAHEQAKSTVEPLLKLAGVEDPMAAVPLVERSLTKSRLEQEISDTRGDLERESDGLTLEEAQEEVAAHPASDASAQLLALEDQLQDSERKLTELAQAQLSAKQVFDAIDGSDKAAVAEAQKQEALAAMAEAGEEYLRIATASSLLKWAVDRYRDRKQGPLLQRASAIFRNLTLGSFEKLRIDYDQNPPTLLAYRPNNQSVKVGGLSDGTRDQLFLALRIAALELQTEQGSPVPFVADDLFINFDDKRSQAGLQALYELSTKAQVLFLSHQEHLLPVVKQMFPQVNVITLTGEEALADV